MPADAAKFVGKWRLVTSENGDEYLKALGCNNRTCKTFGSDETESAVKPVMEFEIDGEHWKRTYTSAFRTNSIVFDLGKEFSGGSKFKCTYSFVGGKLILETKKVDAKYKSSKTVWCVEAGKLIVTNEAETGVKAKRFFERL